MVARADVATRRSRDPDGRGDAGGRPFLTAAEVGAELGLSTSRVYELAAAELLPVVRLGRRLWFPRRGLDALADAAIQRSRDALLRAPQPL